MKDFAQVRQEVFVLGKVALWGVGKEVKRLAQEMDEGEQILGICRAFNGAAIVLLVATDKRLMVLDSRAFYGSDNTEVPFIQIAGVDYRTGLLFGRLEIDSEGDRVVYDWAYNRDLKRFVKTLTRLVRRDHERMMKRKLGGGASTAEEIEKLWSLCQQGVLTKEEFDREKCELLEKN